MSRGVSLAGVRLLSGLLALVLLLVAGPASAGLPMGTGRMGRGIGCDSHCVALLHMDGANGGTAFVDSSPLAHGVNRLTNAGTLPTTSTTQSVFGGSSASIDRKSGLQVTGNIPATNLAGKDFSVEAWVYASLTNTGMVSVQDVAAGAGRKSWSMFYQGGASPQVVQMVMSTDGAAGTTYSTTGKIAVNEWHHVVWQRHAGNLYGYIDGVRSYAAANTSVIYASAYEIIVGTLYNTYPAVSALYGPAGYIDEVRVTAGRAMYPIGGFTVPNRAH